MASDNEEFFSPEDLLPESYAKYVRGNDDNDDKSTKFTIDDGLSKLKNDFRQSIAENYEIFVLESIMELDFTPERITGVFCSKYSKKAVISFASNELALVSDIKSSAKSNWKYLGNQFSNVSLIEFAQEEDQNEVFVVCYGKKNIVKYDIQKGIWKEKITLDNDVLQLESFVSKNTIINRNLIFALSANCMMILYISDLTRDKNIEEAIKIGIENSIKDEKSSYEGYKFEKIRIFIETGKILLKLYLPDKIPAIMLYMKDLFSKQEEKLQTEDKITHDPKEILSKTKEIVSIKLNKDVKEFSLETSLFLQRDFKIGSQEVFVLITDDYEILCIDLIKKRDGKSDFLTKLKSRDIDLTKSKDSSNEFLIYKGILLRLSKHIHKFYSSKINLEEQTGRRKNFLCGETLFNEEIDYLSASPQNNAILLATGSSLKVKRIVNQTNNYLDLGTSCLVIVTPDCKKIVTASIDRVFQIKIWDSQTKQLIHFIPKAHDNLIRYLAVTSDSKFLISCSGDKSIKFWNFETGKLDYDLKNAHDEWINCIALSSDNRYLISGSGDKSIKIWNFETKELLHCISNAHSERISTLAISKDSSLIVSGSSDRSIKIWDFETKQVIHHFPNAHEGWVNNLALTSDSKIIISSSGDKSLRFWSVEKKTMISCNLSAHTNLIRTMNLSADDKYVLTGSDDKSIKIWSVEKRDLVEEIKNTHDNWLNSVYISSDNQFIVSGSGDNTVKYWKLVQEKELIFQLPNVHENWVNYLAISPDCRFIATASGDKSIKIIDVSSKNVIHHFQNAHENYVSAITFTLDSKKIISGSADKSFKVWDLETKQEIEHFRFAHSDLIRSIIISKDGSCFYTASADRAIIKWSLKTYKVIKSISNAHDDWINSICFLNNTDTIISASGDKSIKIWDFSKKEEKPLLYKFENAHHERVNSIAITSCEKILISVSDDKCVNFWDTKSKELLYSMKSCHDDWITSVSLSNDDKFFATSGMDKSIKIWNFETKQLIHHYKNAHTDRINILSFSNDSKFLVSGGNDKAVKVWKSVSSIYNQTNNVSCDDVSKLIKYSTSDLMFLSKNWNPYHYLSIFYPSFLAENIQNIPEIKGSNPYLDVYEKTPIHYLLCTEDDDDSDHISLIHKFFEMILNYLEDIKDENRYELGRTLTSLYLLKKYIFTRIQSSHNIERFLHLFSGKTFPSQSLPHPSEVYGQFLHEKPVLQTEYPFISDKEQLKSILSSKGSQKIIFRSLNIKLDFSIRSESSFQLLELLSEEPRKMFFEAKFIQKFLDILWEKSKPLLYGQTLMFSLLMITLTIDIAFGLNSNDIILFKLINLFVASILIVYEMIQIAHDGVLVHFSSLWNVVDLVCLGILFVTDILRMIEYEFDEDGLVLPWLLVFATLTGYLRWISFLRVIDSTRSLIRMILVVFEDMTSFMIIVILIICSFFTTLMLFKYGDDDYTTFDHFYNAYYYMYSPLEDGIENPTSIKILTLIYPFILNVVFLNMLINIMGDSFDKVQDRIIVTEYKEKVQLLFENAAILRYIFGPKKEEKKAYVIYAEYEEQDAEKEEWEGKIRSIKTSIHSSEENIMRSIQEDIQPKIEFIQNNQERIAQILEKNQIQFEKTLSEYDKKLSRFEQNFMTLSNRIENELLREKSHSDNAEQKFK